MSQDMEREALQKLFDEYWKREWPNHYKLASEKRSTARAAWDAAIDAAIATQPPAVQGEPVAYIHRQGRHWEVSERFLTEDEKARGWTEEPLYTASTPSREVEPLTDEQLIELYTAWSVRDGSTFADLIRAVEAHHGIHCRGEGES